MINWKSIKLDDIDVNDHIKVILKDNSEKEGIYCGITLFEKKWFLDLNLIEKPTMMSVSMTSVEKIYKRS